MLKEIYRSDNLTVFQYKTDFMEKEVIVYGEGSDWIVQEAKHTNYRKPWRHWFGIRSKAEDYARAIAIGIL